MLKSPTHTARVRTILEVFPDAKFIHIVRDPLVLFPSTVRLWKSLSEVQGFQIPRDDAGWIERHVLDHLRADVRTLRAGPRAGAARPA